MLLDFRHQKMNEMFKSGFQIDGFQDGLAFRRTSQNSAGNR